MSQIKSLLAAAIIALGAANSYAAPFVIDSDSYNGHTYKLLSSDTWTESEAFAQSMLGAHLVTIDDMLENMFVISRFGSQQALWLGLRRDGPHSPTFGWADGSAVSFTNWAGGEPNDCGACIGDPDGEQYTHTYTNGTWNDLGNFHGYAGPKFGVVEIAERTSVPEPAMISFMGAGVLLGGLLRRRAKRVG